MTGEIPPTPQDHQKTKSAALLCKDAAALLEEVDTGAWWFGPLAAALRIANTMLSDEAESMREGWVEKSDP